MDNCACACLMSANSLTNAIVLTFSFLEPPHIIHLDFATVDNNKFQEEKKSDYDSDDDTIMKTFGLTNERRVFSSESVSMLLERIHSIGAWQ